MDSTHLSEKNLPSEYSLIASKVIKMTWKLRCNELFIQEVNIQEVV